MFIHDGRFRLPIAYTQTDLNEVVSSQIEKLLAQFEPTLHREQKLSILADVIQNITVRVDERRRFLTLLGKLDDVTQGVNEGYRLFASDFSYEKLKNAVRDAYIEFTGRIHKVFSDIQSQLLAIPVATVIVATQMRHTAGYNNQLWINTGIMLGSVLFAILFSILAYNQWHTLDALGDEIERRKNLIEKDHAALADLEHFGGTFGKLERRLGSQRCLLFAVWGLVLLGALACVVLYFSFWSTPSGTINSR